MTSPRLAKKIAADLWLGSAHRVKWEAEQRELEDKP
jgi:hypothetical protein